jgi:hypothetical protein
MYWPVEKKTSSSYRKSPRSVCTAHVLIPPASGPCAASHQFFASYRVSRECFCFTFQRYRLRLLAEYLDKLRELPQSFLTNAEIMI